MFRFIGSDIYRTSSYGRRHPLSIPRVSTCIDLSRALGWLPDHLYVDSPRATVEELTAFHLPDYVATLQEAERNQRLAPDAMRRTGIGRNGNPIFPEVFSRPATAAGGSLLAARMLRQPGVVYNPAGGTHHGRRAEASGFCYLNDPVLAISRLIELNLGPVLYLDVDAHFADGVYMAFADEPRVSMVSIHEAGRWPMREDGFGGPADRGCGNAWNLPMPRELNDCEFEYVLDAFVRPLIDRLAPETIVLQCGADALAEDPLSRLALSNGSLWRVVETVRAAAPRVLVLGGGGYNPWAVGRCWAGVWATLAGHEIPDCLPGAARAILSRLEWHHSRGRNPPAHWFTTLADPPNWGPVRGEVRNLVATLPHA